MSTRTSPVLRAAAAPLALLMLLVSLALLLRGHNAPGGGFSGGMLAGLALTLYALGRGPSVARRVLRVHPRLVIAVGIGLLAVAALAPVVAGDPLLTAQVWAALPMLGKVGTVLVFDAGVYLVVAASTLLILVELMEA